jgi:SOS-response transcriptional repressor LexA
MTETIGARVVARAKSHLGLNATEFAARLGVAYETIRKWIAGETAPNRSRMTELAQILEVSERWLRFGEEPSPEAVKGFTNVNFPDTNYQPGLVYGWEEVIKMFRAGMEDMLPAVFSVELTDDALQGRARKGDVITLSKKGVETVEAGDGVLVKTANDHFMLRIYRPKGDGTFLAEATNPNFLPLHSEDDGLTILAVVVGVPACRWSAL